MRKQTDYEDDHRSRRDTRRVYGNINIMRLRLVRRGPNGVFAPWWLSRFRDAQHKIETQSINIYINVYACA